MKKREVKKINLGEDFEIVNNNKINYYCKQFKTMYQCYNRPSQEKESIYNYYYNLLLNNCDSVLSYGVRSYNTFMITLNAIIEKDNKRYYVLITPAHNYIIEITKDYIIKED